MKLNRRQLLQGAGVVSVLVLGGGVYRTVDQGILAAGAGPAYTAWRDWRTAPAEGALRLVQSAILASNPHNTQPWLFQVTETAVTLYADTSRHLGAMDPYLREMHIGLGCAIENMLITAAAVGYAVGLTSGTGELTPPAATPQLEEVATLTLTPAEAQSNPLYAAIPDRHTNRFNYDTTRTIAPALLAELTALAATSDVVKLFTFDQNHSAFQPLAAATIRATETIIADHEMAYDGYRWLNQSWQAVQAKKDGLYMDTAGLPDYVRVVAKLMPSLSQARFDAGWLANTQATLQQSTLLGLLAVRDLYSKSEALAAGQLWQRLHLWATVNGLAMQPINQLPEVVDRDRQLGRTSQMASVLDELTGDPTWRPTFVFRMGYPHNAVRPSARRPVTEVLI